MLLIPIFILGLFFGSFLNVLIGRLPRGENPFKGRSRCDFCHKTLSIFDLIPVISYALLGGKCRYCHKTLSLQYAIMEVVTGLLFAFTFLFVFHGASLNLLETFSTFSLPKIAEFVGLLIVFTSFLVIFLVDAKHQFIPDEMVISSLVGSLLYSLSIHANILTLVATGAIATLIFLAIYGATKGRGMGFGDVKLVFVLGMLLGPVKTIIGLYAAFLTGAVISIILLLRKVKKLKSKIAFGPFLILGALISFFYGNLLIQWYTSHFF